MKLLIVEDEPNLLSILRKGFAENNNDVSVALDGKTALEMIHNYTFDVVVLDVMLPDINGIEICRRLRASKNFVPVLLLTALGTSENIVTGLNAGADDYLVKPFELAELLARLRALTRRAYVPIVGDCVSLGSFELDRTNRVIRQREEEILLSPREFGLLDLLVQNKGQVLPRELILDRVWGYDADVSLKIVDATVKLLRKKLDVFGQQDVIQSIRGVGYKIED